MNWTKKLTSRKFWVAVAGPCRGRDCSPGHQDGYVADTGVIMALGSVIAYIVGEGLMDAAAVGNLGDKQ